MAISADKVGFPRLSPPVGFLAESEEFQIERLFTTYLPVWNTVDEMAVRRDE